MITDRPVLVTGATGYVGGRLVPRLLDAGYRVRCIARHPRKLLARPWASDPRAEIVSGDAGDARTLARAMTDCQAAYYLIHSMMAAGADYRDQDRRLAATFAEVAEQCGVDRIIYLGGLGETGEELSEHLTSRREVEEALASGSVSVTVLRAAMIVGSGSASFEILRYLVERLPVMTTPRWVSTESQPIAIRDALRYLVECLHVPETTGRVLEIGGPDVLTYRDLMRVMARALDLRERVVIPLPVLTPKLSSLWIHLVTPVNARFARPLAEGLRNRVVCRSDEARRLMPFPLTPMDEAIEYAVGKHRAGDIETMWTDAGPIPGDPDWAGGTKYADTRSTWVRGSVEKTFLAISRIGGTRGWFAANGLWRIRGGMDRLLGGPGLDRGRRDPVHLRYGDVIDFWRVTEVVPDRRVRLRAEMRLPGEATLTFDIVPDSWALGASFVTQTARFKPKGLLGILYWHVVAPFHNIVFRGLLHGIRESAETLGVSAPAPGSAPRIKSTGDS